MSFANRLFFCFIVVHPLLNSQTFIYFSISKIFLLLRVLDLLFSYSVFKVHGRFRPFSILLNTESFIQSLA